MRKAIGTLQKVVVNYFYMVNAGLFLFGFIVLFGLPYTPVAFHLSLIAGIIQSQAFTAIVMLCWLIYNLKCINYVLKQLNHPRQSFLFCINGLSNKAVFLCMVYVQIIVYMPVLLYSVAIVWQAYLKQKYACALEVVAFHILVIVLTAYVYALGIKKKQVFTNRLLLPAIHIHIAKPLFLYPLYFLLHDRKQMLIVAKTFSLLLLYGFIVLYEPERYDIRPLQLCLLLVAAFHCAIVFEIQNFEQEYLDFSKNLPFTAARRFTTMAAMYACLLLPEFLFLFKGFGVHFVLQDYPALVLLTLGLVCMFHTVLLIENTNMDQLLRIVFGILAACFFIILYNPGWLLGCAIMLLAFALYHTYFYTYERKSS